MDSKWIDRAYQFDDDDGAGGGGGEPTPPQEPTGDPAPPDGGDPGGEPSPPSGDPPGEPTPPEPAGSVALPEGLGGLFAPAEPAPPQPGPAQTWTPPTPPGPTPTQTPEPQGPKKVDFPDGDDWLADPGKAAQQHAEAIAYSNWEAQAPLRQEISELRRGVDGMKDADFETISSAVHRSIDHAEASVKGLYDEKGPLNADSEFRNNPDVQKAVENIIGACVTSAIRKADRTGDTSSLDRISNDPRFPYRCLAMAKADAQNVPEGALRPGASPVGPQPPQPAANAGLSEEDAKALAAARADGVKITAADIRRARKVTSESIY